LRRPNQLASPPLPRSDVSSFVSTLSVKPPPTSSTSLLSAQRRAAVDEQLGRACAGPMDSSLASTPRRGGCPQGVGRATSGATKKPTSSTFLHEHLNAVSRFRPPSGPDVVATSFASSARTSSAHQTRRRPPGGTSHQRPARPTRTTVEEPSGELLSSRCPQNLGAGFGRGVAMGSELPCFAHGQDGRESWVWPDLAHSAQLHLTIFSLI
jgi:hypothetical protein